MVLIVDASDSPAQAHNATLSADYPSLHIRHLSYPDPPSLARQRNFAIDHAPPLAQILFFLDDDVSLEPGYFDAILNLFDQFDGLGGVGARITEPSKPSPDGLQRGLRHLFLLDHLYDGRVLLSGHVSPQPSVPRAEPCQVQWLSGCAMAFRHSTCKHMQFDSNLDGPSLMEDLDFSYRVGRTAPLMVAPSAHLIHHASPVNRHDAVEYRCASVIHRYWFVEKNIQHPLRKPAFWWATIGQLLATISSRKPQKWESLRGLWQGIRAVWLRDHPLLQHDP